jgi:3',5'-cyclic AMP phosphodiesterase CpdA
MRTLAHISDLHFGRTDPAMIEPLLRRLAEIDPDLVAVSGDLTQRARGGQFEEARAFLDRLPARRLVVPGNHDVPLYRVWERFLSPLGKYRHYIDADLEHAFVDEEIAVLGVNTARSLTFKGGRINEEQIESLRRRLQAMPESLTKVIVTHHPFDIPDEPGNNELVGRADEAMAAFADCGVDILLSGHFHTSRAGETSGRHPLAGYAALAVQAGTATSTRGRGEANSFNVLRVEHDTVALELNAWRPEAASFIVERTERFRREKQRWIEVAA